MSWPEVVFWSIAMVVGGACFCWWIYTINRYEGDDDE